MVTTPTLTQGCDISRWFMITVPRWAVIRAYTPPLAPDRNTLGLTTLVHREPASTPLRYTAATRQALGTDVSRCH